MRASALRVLAATQVVFFGALVWCVVLSHGHAAENAGISYYGVHARTLALAIVGYGAAAVGLWRTSTLFVAGVDAVGWVGLRVVAVMLPVFS